MAKIGRNAPCPCGSGKKYKKCCLHKNASAPAQPPGKRRIHWSISEIESFSTDEIVSKLRAFGAPFEKDRFLTEVKRFYSAEELAGHWWQKYSITATGFDEDFLWMACVVLWNRLAPDVVNSERLNDMMQQGYDLLEQERKGGARTKVVEACNLWLEAWEHLKQRFTADMKTIEDTGRVFVGAEELFNWCQDLEIELLNAGLVDPALFEKRIRYCREFCDLFPDSDELLMCNMKRAEAEAHFALGRQEEGDRLFAELVARFPANPWGYIGWGDMYAWPLKNEGARDVEKAKRLYEMGLQANVKDKQDILDRLKGLEEED